MPNQTVPTPTDKDEPKVVGYAATAAELRRIADALDTLPPVDKTPYVSLAILTEHTVEAVDSVAMAVLGEVGRCEHTGTGWRHIADGPMWTDKNFYVSVHASVDGPPDPRDLELELLRAEVAAFRSAFAPMPVGQEMVGPREVDNGDTPIPLEPGVFGEHEGAEAGRALQAAKSGGR